MKVLHQSRAKGQEAARSISTTPRSSRVAPSQEETLESIHDISQRPQFAGLSGEFGLGSSQMPIQTKMRVGEVGDRYEQEADRLAPQIVRQINAPGFGEQLQDSQSETQGDTPSKQLQTLRPTLQLKGESTGGAVSPAIEVAIASARGGGRPLETGLQERFRQVMGVDFSGVRVHIDAQANALNQALSSQAFTTRQDIFFRQGTYQPESREGQELLAHELAHVTQQCGRNGSELTTGQHLKDFFHRSSFTRLSNSLPHAPMNVLQRVPLRQRIGNGFSVAGQVISDTARFVGRGISDTARSVWNNKMARIGARSVGGVLASPAVSLWDAGWRSKESKPLLGNRLNKYYSGKDSDRNDITEKLEEAYGGKNFARIARSLQVLGEVCDNVFKWSGSIAALSGLISIGVPAAAPVAAIAVSIAGWAGLAKYGLKAVMQAWAGERANQLYSQIRALYEKSGNFNSPDAKALILAYISTLGENKANKLEYAQALATTAPLLVTSGISAAISGAQYAETVSGNFGLIKPETLDAAAKSAEKAHPWATGVGVVLDTGIGIAQEHLPGVKKIKGTKADEIEAGKLPESVGFNDPNAINDLGYILKNLPPPKHKNFKKNKAHLLNPINWIIWGLKKILNIAEVIRNSFKGDSEHKAKIQGAIAKVGATNDNQSGTAYQVVEGIKTQLGDKTKLGRKALKFGGGLISGTVGGALGAGAGAATGLLAGMIRGAKIGFAKVQSQDPNLRLDNWQSLDATQRARLVFQLLKNYGVARVAGLLGGLLGAGVGTLSGLAIGAIGGAKGGYQAGRGAAKAGQTLAEGTWDGLGKLAGVSRLDKINKVYGVGAMTQGVGNLTRGGVSAGMGAIGFVAQSVTAGLASGVGAGLGTAKKIHNSPAAAASIGNANASGILNMLEKAKGYVAQAEKAVQDISMPGQVGSP